MQNPPLIALRGITKAFPGVMANDQIDLDIHAAEIHALLGENGAGKSTLMKILFGFYRADAGEILLNGKPLVVRSPREARAAGIGMVFQELNLIPAFSVAENIALFLPDLPQVLDPRAIDQRIQAVSKRYGLEVNPRALVSQLSIGEQQKVEILKLLLSDARLLILDEPTRVLAPHEVRALFDTLASLRKDGYAIVLITHKMKEVLECADRITVLRGGRLAGSRLRSEASEDVLVALMFEKAVAALDHQQPRVPAGAAVPALELRGVETESALRGIDLQILPGEILGIAGVSGNGQKELCEAVLGMEPCTKGRKLLYGEDVTDHSTWMMRRAGVSFIPENPLTMASVPFMTVLENLALTNTWRYAGRGGLSMDWQAVKADGQATAERLGFPVSFHALARSLSGGNLQRMIIVREMSHGPRLVIASYLTRGLDVQSAVAARQALIQARASGAGVLLISEDLDELFVLSDRLLVLFAGRIVGEFKPAETDAYQVGHLMTGSKAEHVQDR
jgi:simple sugar transport system ATP-binding protein